MSRATSRSRPIVRAAGARRRGPGCRAGAPADGLHGALDAALATGDEQAVATAAALPPRDRRDAALALGLVHDLHLAPLPSLGGRAAFQHHPAVAALKCRLEASYGAILERLDAAQCWDLPDDPVAAVRAIGARDQVPELYRWVAEEATGDELRAFLALEGGPDAGFDDLVALCQVGLDGEPKLELAQNYADEMGDGDADRVHTELYRRFVRAVDLDPPPPPAQPVDALHRSLLGSYLATNRSRQPELVGALGVIELQAGPRCRRVLAGFDRLGLGADAREFYREHAETDPRHGRAWLDRVIAPLADDPWWAEGIVRGARWRWLVNDRFFRAMAEAGRPAAATPVAGARP